MEQAWEVVEQALGLGLEGKYLTVAQMALRAAANNSMHPTADTPPLIFGSRSGRRVMRCGRWLQVMVKARTILQSKGE